MSFITAFFRIFLISLLVVLGIFSYGENESIPEYCSDKINYGLDPEDEDEVRVPEYCDEDDFDIDFDDYPISYKFVLTCTKDNVSTNRSCFLDSKEDAKTECCSKVGGCDDSCSIDAGVTDTTKYDHEKNRRKENCERAEGRFQEEREKREKYCENLEKGIKEAEEARVEAEEQARKEQEEKIRTQDQECDASYQRTLSERRGIEQEVNRKQADLDKIEDQITAAHTRLSEAEDQVKEEILRLRENYRRSIDQAQSQIRETQSQNLNQRQAFEKTIEQIEVQIFQEVKKLEQYQITLSQICSKRSNSYLEISSNCHNEALKQVSAEREDLFKRIRNDSYEPGSMSQLFQSDAEGLEQTFRQRLVALRHICYRSQTGGRLSESGEPLTNYPSCNLESLTKRKGACDKIKNKNSQCPRTPQVIRVEGEALQALQSLKQQEELSEKSMESLNRSIDRAKENEDFRKTQYEEILTQLDEQMTKSREDFEKRSKFLENRLQKVREESENEIFSLDRKRMRILTSDPARHFQETLYLTRMSCCTATSPKSTNLCDRLDSYERDLDRYGFTEIKNLPYVERSRPKSSGSGGVR